MRTAIRQPRHVKSKILLQNRFGALCVRVRFDIVLDLAVDTVLGISFIDKSNRSKFPSKHKIVPRHYHPVPVFFSDHQQMTAKMRASALTSGKHLTHMPKSCRSVFVSHDKFFLNHTLDIEYRLRLLLLVSTPPNIERRKRVRGCCPPHLAL